MGAPSGDFPEMKRFITLSLLSLAAFCAQAQIVEKVTFQQQGPFLFSEDLFEFNTQTKKGTPYSERVVNEDVRRLFSKGMFADVVSRVVTLPNGNKEVIFVVSPKSVVSSISFEGNEKYPEKKLREHVRLHESAPLNDALLNESAQALRKFYQDEGLNDAEIGVSLVPDGEQIKVVFKIAEHLRVRVDEVRFEGVSAYDPSDLKSELETRYTPLSADWLAWLPLEGGLGLLNREAIERDKVRLRELYWRKGYLDFKVNDVRIEQDPANPEMARVTFVVEEGKPYFVGEVKVTGAEHFTDEELAGLISLKPEDVYSSEKERRDVEALESRYSPLGYADFAATVVRRPNYKTRSVDLEYRISEGPQYTIGEVYIAGNKWTKDYVIRRELLLTPGDPVDRDLVKISKSRLMGMGYFEGKTGGGDGVDIVTVNSPEPNKKDIHVNVEEKRFITGSIGAGWSDTDGLAGTIQLAHTNMDILDPENYFTGGGQRMRISALAGLEHFDVQADFTEPYLFGIPLRLDVSAYWRQVIYDDWDEQRLGFRIALTKRVFDDFTTISGGYLFEYVRVLDMTRHFGPIFQEAEGGEFVGKVFFSINRDTRDSATDPTSGYFVGFDTYLASKALGGSNNYYKLEFKAVNYYPFLHDWFVLTTGFKTGTLGMIGGGRVPIYDRYFLGGGDSIRGFPYRSIGPVDEDDHNFGGQFMYVFTAELSHPIYGPVRGAFFVDVGDVMEDRFGPFEAPNVGIGYGLRIKLPGVQTPIRLDLAYPIYCNQEDVSRRLRFHFNMGFSI